MAYPESFKARETVANEIPANFATSLIVAMDSPHSFLYNRLYAYT